MKTTTQTIGEAIAFQLRETGSARIIMSRDNENNETAIIHNEEFKEICIVQELEGEITTTFLNESEIEALKEILQ